MSPQFEIKFAATPDDLRAAQRLRYDVFVLEMGSDGTLVDHDARLEQDSYDDQCLHLILFDRARAPGDQAVGVYRLLPEDRAVQGFYSETEYDLAPLLQSGRKLLELGRSCLHRDYRGGMAMHLLWQHLARYVQDTDVGLLFGTASFRGTNVADLAAPLSLLHYRHLAPAALRPRARDEHYQRMDLIPESDLDRRAAVRQIPSLIKAYLRLGGVVGDGAYIDHAFNTTDIFLLVDMATLSARQKAIYAAERGT